MLLRRLYYFPLSLSHARSNDGYLIHSGGGIAFSQNKVRQPLCSQSRELWARKADWMDNDILHI